MRQTPIAALVCLSFFSSCGDAAGLSNVATDISKAVKKVGKPHIQKEAELPPLNNWPDSKHPLKKDAVRKCMDSFIESIGEELVKSSLEEILNRPLNSGPPKSLCVLPSEERHDSNPFMVLKAIRLEPVNAGLKIPDDFIFRPVYQRSNPENTWAAPLARPLAPLR